MNRPCLRLILVVVGLMSVVWFEQLQPQPAYQQSVKTSTTYSTEVLTVPTTQIFTITRTKVSTIIYPPPPNLAVKCEYRRWIFTGTTQLIQVDIWGNATNRSELLLQQVKLKFLVIEGDKSELCTHMIPSLGAGQTHSFYFDFTPTKQFDYRYTYVRYSEFDYELGGAIQTTTILRTSMIFETSKLVKDTALTTVHTILSTYTEPSLSLLGGLYLIVTAIVVAAIAAVAVVALRRKSTRQASTASRIIQPETTARLDQTGKTCPKCSSTNDLGATFCVSCGYKFQ